MTHKRVLNKHIILFNIVICFIMNSQFLNLHYSADAFNILNSNNQNALIHIQSGRFLSTILIEIFNLFNINLITSVAVWASVFLISNALISYYFSDFFIHLFQYKNSHNSTHLWLINCGMLLLINNIFSAELLTFSESIPIYTVAHICAVFSVVLITNSSKMKKAFGLFLLMVSFNTYQVFVTEYVYLVMISIFIKNNGRITKDSVKQILESASYAFITVFSNILIVRYFIYKGWIAEYSRYNFSFAHAAENFLKFLKEQMYIWGSGQGLMPHGFMLLFLVFLIIVLSRKLYNIKIPVDTAIFIILTLMSGFMCIGAMTVIQGNLIWLPPRTLAPLFGIFTILIFMIVYYYRDNEIPQLIIAPVFLFIFINIFYVQSYASNLKASNEMDYQWVKNIEYEISRYESKTGKEIFKIGFIQDKNVDVRWDDSIRYRYDVVIRAPFVDWEQINIVNYYTGRKFEKINLIPGDIENYFKSRDWNTYCPDEQLIFKDDTLFIGVY